jgi:hypothetical protein
MRLARWQRTVLRFVVVPLLALVGAAALFYFVVLDTSYSSAAFYADTGLGSEAGTLTYIDKPGRATLVIVRGQHESRLLGDADTGWREEINVDLPSPGAGDHIDLSGPDIRVSYAKIQPLAGRWTIGDRGVRGSIDVEAVGPDRITAHYDIVVDAYNDRFVPEVRHRELVFRGRATFRSASRPAGEPPGKGYVRPL